MDRGNPSNSANTTEFHSGLPSPYPSHNGDNRSEASPQDQQPSVSAAFSHPEHRPPFAGAATSTPEHGAGYPATARAAQQYSERQQQLQHAYPYATVSMASQSSSLNLPDGADAAHAEPQEDAPQLKSDPDVPIDTTIHSQQSPPYYASGLYGAAGDHPGHYAQHAVYQPPRPDWTGYSAAHTPLTPNHHGVFHHQQTTPTGQRAPGNQVFSFVPIPGSQQHKRPRRRYEEIERMYKCGWNGCEKAYGTLNHLNAHVTMQSHGTKRIPEEFKEIRKEWKAKKKAEEAARKTHEDQTRADGQTSSADSQSGHDGRAYSSRNLPAPLTYNAAEYPTQPQFATASGDYGNSYASSASSFNAQTSPYAQSHQQVYGTQSSGGQMH